MNVIDKNHLPLIHKKKQYIEVPLPITCGIIRKIWHRLIGIILLPGYVFAAWLLKAPGITLHLKCVFLVIRLFVLRRISLRTFDSLVFFPMDSTRYFEFHEVLNGLAHMPFSKYLDVSSPRLAPLMLLKQNRNSTAELLNPDIADLQETRNFATALGLQNRCNFVNTTIGNTTYPAETFDLITCISVLEHIPSDREAVEKMWSLLRSGGRLILTLPCMAHPMEQYISHNEYGVLSPGTDGYTFWQRYYGEERLREVIFSITGPPAKAIVYGEKSNGLFYRNMSMKRLMGPLYPFWRESYMMAAEYRYFNKISELPGEGVVMLEFAKP
jgi:SAM-dependent methyltransferase